MKKENETWQASGAQLVGGERSLDSPESARELPSAWAASYGAGAPSAGALTAPHTCLRDSQQDAAHVQRKGTGKGV